MSHVQEMPRIDGTAVIIILFLQVVAYLNIPWISYEIVSAKGQPQIVGQVLSADGNWTTVLERIPRGVRLIPTSDVVTRTPCVLDNSVLSKSVIAIALSSIYGQPAVCPEVKL